MAAQHMTKTQYLPWLSLHCHPIQLGIHKDPSIGAHTYGCLIILAAGVVAGIVSYSRCQKNCSVPLQ